MKTTLPLLLCILFSAVVVNAQTPIGIGPGTAMWSRYTVKGEEFSVALPREPSLTTSEVMVRRTNRNRVERILQSNASGLNYVIYVYENPKPRQSLEEFIDEQSTGFTLNRSSEREVTTGKFKGREYTSQDGKTIEQFFATDKRLYRFVVSGSTTEQWRVTQFFASIAIGKKLDSIEVLEGSSPADDLAAAVRSKDVDQKPKILKKPMPNYSNEARNHQVRGTVILRVLLSASGQVNNIRVVTGLPHGLTEQAIAAARKIQFVPALKDGKNVSMWVELEYNFNIY